ncbi:ABC transporter substrate-binding protein [Nesterenkonia alba]|uniref:ABC transporter substrate-binding protein n=1 Tax=Nesterenkonia alba TaxID=515814 RepID=UPI0003F7D870|nr:extracellular solute-binding protein [Nesterenkonia alba]
MNAPLPSAVSGTAGLRLLAAGSLAALLALTACADNLSENEASAETNGAAENDNDDAGTTEDDRTIGESIDELHQLAQEEGTVHLIAYPETWANYAKHFDEFEAAFPGVEIEVSSPNASSAEELEAVRTLRGQSTQPDVLDIGFSFTEPAKDEDLLDHYVPTVADEVPADLIDEDGYWVGAYYGVLSIGVDADAVEVPTSFANLTDEQYCGQITVGDPREGASVFAAVFAASLAHGGSLDDIQPGIDFFAELAENDCLVESTSVASALETGEAAVTFDWNYNYTGIEDQLADAGVNMEVVTPEDGVFGNFYAQPVTVESPQPNAGRLWIEWLLSDEGANVYAEAGAVPARYQAMVDAGTLTPEAEAGLPPAEILESIAFPSMEQGDTASDVVVENWGPQVANR